MYTKQEARVVIFVIVASMACISYNIAIDISVRIPSACDVVKEYTMFVDIHTEGDRCRAPRMAEGLLPRKAGGIEMAKAHTPRWIPWAILAVCAAAAIPGLVQWGFIWKQSSRT